MSPPQHFVDAVQMALDEWRKQNDPADVADPTLAEFIADDLSGFLPEPGALYVNPTDAPALFFYDGAILFRADVPERNGGYYDRRTRALLRALLNVAEADLDDQDDAACVSFRSKTP